MICPNCVHALVKKDFEGNVRTSCVLDGAVLSYRVVECCRFEKKDEKDTKKR